jgi:hypothetical protein
MIPCAACQRHIRRSAYHCPFCGAPTGVRSGHDHLVFAFAITLAVGATLGCTRGDDTEDGDLPSSFYAGPDVEADWSASNDESTEGVGDGVGDGDGDGDGDTCTDTGETGETGGTGETGDTGCETGTEGAM